MSFNDAFLFQAIFETSREVASEMAEFHRAALFGCMEAGTFAG